MANPYPSTAPAAGPMTQPRTTPSMTLLSMVCRPRAKPVPAMAPINAWFMDVK